MLEGLEHHDDAQRERREREALRPQPTPEERELIRQELRLLGFKTYVPTPDKPKRRRKRSG